MSFDLWAQEYCLACDKQVHIDGAAYCSEACRLSDFEKTSTSTSSPSTSPILTAASSWHASHPTSRPPSYFYLPPAYDFSNAKPYGTTLGSSAFRDTQSPSKTTHATSAHQLTPSSSHSSLCSMRSTSSSSSDGQVSDTAKKELRAYAVSFEQVRTQRRRSY